LEEKLLESDYVKAVITSEVPVGALKKVIIQNKEILIANVNGDFSAIDSVCTHFGGDLSQGILESNVLTCPRHQAKFDVTTGRVLVPPNVEPYNPKIENLKAYSLRIENETVFIKM